MRTKKDILDDVRGDINDDDHKTDAHLWVQYRYIEVLIDIRDILAADMKTSIEISKAMAKRGQNARKGA